MSELEEARRRMIEKRFGGNAKGAAGDGNIRRKAKGNPKSIGDDKKLGGVLKKMGLTNLNGVEEVNIFKTDGDVIHITTPKIQASIPSNCFVISGDSETKPVAELLPGILTQLGPVQMDRLKSLVESQGGANYGGMGAGAAGGDDDDDDDDDDDVPELVENFEEAAKA